MRNPLVPCFILWSFLYNPLFLDHLSQWKWWQVKESLRSCGPRISSWLVQGYTSVLRQNFWSLPPTLKQDWRPWDTIRYPFSPSRDTFSLGIGMQASFLAVRWPNDQVLVWVGYFNGAYLAGMFNFVFSSWYLDCRCDERSSGFHLDSEGKLEDGTGVEKSWKEAGFLMTVLQFSTLGCLTQASRWENQLLSFQSDYYSGVLY